MHWPLQPRNTDEEALTIADSRGLLPPDLPQRNSRRLIISVIDDQTSLIVLLDDGLDGRFFHTPCRQTHEDAVTDDLELPVVWGPFAGGHARNVPFTRHGVQVEVDTLQDSYILYQF
jgi:hypothetical protein